MSNNPGRKMRRQAYFAAKRAAGKRRMRIHNYYMSHQWLPKFRRFREEVNKREARKT